MRTKQGWMRNSLLIAAFGWFASIQPVIAQYTVLHNFTGGAGDGAQPFGDLVLSDSMLYGMTYYGGTNDGGVIFKMNSDGSGYQVLHTFLGYPVDGDKPIGSLTLSGSTLYGMTSTGGTNNPGGTVFKINTDGHYHSHGTVTGYNTYEEWCDAMRALGATANLEGKLKIGNTTVMVVCLTFGSDAARNLVWETPDSYEVGMTDSKE